MSVINTLKKTFNWQRLKNNLFYLLKYDLFDERYKIKDETIEDCIYEFDEIKPNLKQLDVLDENDTIELLKTQPKSFARYGDGEIAIMRGEDSIFQEYNAKLASRLKELLIRKKDNLYIGLNSSYFHSPTRYSSRNRKFYRLYATEYRRFFVNICDPNNVYLDACCFGGYFRHGDTFDFDAHFSKVKELFKGKSIVIVCGTGILEKLESNIFELGTVKGIVSAPTKNAFDKYDIILKETLQKASKDDLVCIILGMTATVLAADLADAGYLAWDVGHMAKDYDAYIKKLEKTDAVIDNFFAPD